MRPKYLVAPITLVASLALVFGPALADDVDSEIPDDCTEVVDEGGTDDVDVVEEAAQDAATAAEELEEGDACPELESGRERAVQALQSAVDRLSAEGAGGNGVAAAVLTALINGESPSGIGAAHGAAMAQAAADRRAERANEEAESDDESDDDESDDDSDSDDGVVSAGSSKGHGRP